MAVAAGIRVGAAVAVGSGAGAAVGLGTAVAVAAGSGARVAEGLGGVTGAVVGTAGWVGVAAFSLVDASSPPHPTMKKRVKASNHETVAGNRIVCGLGRA